MRALILTLGVFVSVCTFADESRSHFSCQSIMDYSSNTRGIYLETERRMYGRLYPFRYLVGKVRSNETGNLMQQCQQLKQEIDNASQVSESVFWMFHSCLSSRVELEKLMFQVVTEHRMIEFAGVEPYLSRGPSPLERRVRVNSCQSMN